MFEKYFLLSEGDEGASEPLLPSQMVDKPSTVEEPSTETTEPAEPEKRSYSYKYDKEDTSEELTDQEVSDRLREAKYFAEKVKPNLDSLKRNNSVMERVLKLAGMDNIDDYVKSLNETQMQAIELEKKELIDKGFTEEKAESYVAHKREALEASMNEPIVNKEQQETAEVDAFLKNFPDVNIDSLPNEVLTEWASGKPLTESYLMHKLSTVEKSREEIEKEVIEKIAKNNGSSIDKPGAKSGDREQKVYNYNNMTSRELQKATETGKIRPSQMK